MPMTDERMTRRFWISDEAFEGLLESFIDGYLEKEAAREKGEVPVKEPPTRKKAARSRPAPKRPPRGSRGHKKGRDSLG
jgi:hypothetical protein